MCLFRSAALVCYELVGRMLSGSPFYVAPGCRPSLFATFTENAACVATGSASWAADGEAAS